MPQMWLISQDTELRIALGYLTPPPDTFFIRVGIPVRRCDRIDVLNIHRVDLLECPILGLNNEEEYYENKSRTTTGKYETV